MESSPEVLGTTYVLAVQNLEKSVDFYKKQLGFETNWTDEGWHCVRLDKINIMLGECKNDVSAFETNNHSYFAYIDIRNVREFYRLLQQKDIEFTSELKDQPWGQREFGIRTIDGHRIMFGESL